MPDMGTGFVRCHSGKGGVGKTTLALAAEVGGGLWPEPVVVDIRGAVSGGTDHRTGRGATARTAQAMKPSKITRRLRSNTAPADLTATCFWESGGVSRGATLPAVLERPGHGRPARRSPQSHRRRGRYSMPTLPYLVSRLFFAGAVVL